LTQRAVEGPFDSYIFAAAIFPKSMPYLKKFFVLMFIATCLKDIPKDLIFLGLLQNVYVYRMAKSKKI